MEVIKSIFRYIFAIIFAVCIVVLIAINISSSTIFDKNYVTKKMEETGYYDKVLEYENSNIEKYLVEVGIDASLLDGIIVKDDIVNDTQKILNNIYNNAEEKVTTENLKTRLNENLEKAIQEGKITTEQRDTFNSHINDIEINYSNSIAYMEFEKTIYNEYHKLNFVADAYKLLILLFIGVAVFGLVVTSGIKIHKFFIAIGVSLIIIGLGFIGGNIFVNAKYDIQTIVVLNDTFSFIFREIISEMLGQILVNGILLLFGGIILILVTIFIHNYFKQKIYGEVNKKKKKKDKIKMLNEAKNIEKKDNETKESNLEDEKVKSVKNKLKKDEVNDNNEDEKTTVNKEENKNIDKVKKDGKSEIKNKKNKRKNKKNNKKRTKKEIRKKTRKEIIKNN